MGILKGLLGLADDIISIPTDMIGLTNHFEKKEKIKRVENLYINGEITTSQYRRLLLSIENE